MATLPTLRPGAPNTTSLPTSGNSLFGNPASGNNTALSDDSDTTYDGQNTNSSGTYEYGRELGNMPTDFAHMDTITSTYRRAWESAPSNSTWDSTSMRIMRSDGTTPLAGNSVSPYWILVEATVNATTPANSGPAGGWWVDTSADKSVWDSAIIQYRVTRTRSKGGDSLGQRIYEISINGTYTQSATTVSGSFSADSVIKKTGISGTFTADAVIKRSWNGYAPVVVETQSSTTDDDGYVQPGTSWNADDPRVSDDGICAWFRFPNVQVPQYATVEDAHLVLVALGANIDNDSFITTYIGVLDDDNHVAPTSLSEWTSDHANHIDELDFFVNPLISSGTQTTPSFHSQAHTLINGAGWSAGNAIGVHIDTDVIADLEDQQWRGGQYGAQAPKLVIQYLTPTTFTADAYLVNCLVDDDFTDMASSGLAPTDGTEWVFNNSPVDETWEGLDVVYDDFSGSASSGLDDPRIGGSWNIIQNGGSDSNVNEGSGVGTFFVPAGNRIVTTLDQIDAVDIDLTALVEIDTDPADHGAGIRFREQGSENTYEAGIWFENDGTTTTYLHKYVSGSGSPVISGVSKGSYDASDVFAIRVRAVGTSIKVKTWFTNSGQPSTWDIDTTDSTYTANGEVGLAAVWGGGSTEPTISWHYLRGVVSGKHIIDTFTGTNGTGLNNRETDTGETWTADSAITIQSNRIVSSSAFNGAEITAATDGDASIDIYNLSESVDTRISLKFRFLDFNNYMEAWLYRSSDGGFRSYGIQKVEGGSGTYLIDDQGADDVSAAGPHNLAVKFHGDLIELWFDGTQVESTKVSPFLINSYRMRIDFDNGGAGEVDNFTFDSYGAAHTYLDTANARHQFLTASSPQSDYKSAVKVKIEDLPAVASDGMLPDVTDGLGSADFGGSYTLEGTASLFDKSGGFATLAVPAATNSELLGWLDDVQITDAEVLFKVRVDAANADVAAMGILRGDSGTDYGYQFGIWFESDGTTTAIIREKNGGGSFSNTFTTGQGSYSANEDWWVRGQAIGSDLRCKVWKDGSAEPVAWATTDTDTTITGAGGTGISGLITFGGTSRTLSFSDFTVRPPAGATNGKIAYVWGRANNFSYYGGSTILSSYDGYTAYIAFEADHAVSVGVTKFISGSETDLDSGATGIGDIGTWQPGEYWWLELDMSGTSLGVRAWKDGDAKPITALATGTDNDYSSGVTGIGVYNPNAEPVTYTWGALTVCGEIGGSVNGSFTANSVIKKTDISGTFTADAILLETYSQSFSADAVLLKNVSQTFTADSILFKTIEQTFLADSVILRTIESTLTADAILVATIEDTFTADAVILKAQEFSFTADAVIKKTDLPFTFTADSIILKAQEFTYTADAVISKTFETTYTADALLLLVVSDSFTADAVIFKTQEFTFTADAILVSTISDSFTADAILFATIEDSFTADSVIFKTLEFTFTADAYISGTVSATFDADAVILKTQEFTFNADAWLVSVVSDTFTADATLFGTVPGSFTADSILLDTQEQTFTADAILLETFSGSFTSNTVILKTFETTLTADAWLISVVSDAFTADSIVLKTQEFTFTADAWMILTVEDTLTADSILFATLPFSFSADSVLFDTVEQTFTADAILTETTEDTLTADSILFKTSEVTFTADSTLFDTIEQSLTADSILFKTSEFAFTADSILLEETSDSFTADSELVNVGTPHWTTPLDTATISTTPVLAFTIPEAISAMHFNIEIDSVATFDSPGDLRIYKSSDDQTDWEYWNDSAWTPVPASGVPNTYAGNEARLTVSSPLSSGNWYRRVRAGI